jgi:hypothetical protein
MFVKSEQKGRKIIYNKKMTKNKLEADISKLDAQIAILEGRRTRKKLKLLEKSNTKIVPEDSPTTSEPETPTKTPNEEIVSE